MCPAMLMRTFNFSTADPTYELRIKQALAVKPVRFFARPRQSGRLSIPHTLTSSSISIRDAGIANEGEAEAETE